MSRTTLAIEDSLLRQLKLRAVRQGCSLQTVVNALLRQALHAPPRSSYRLHLEGWDGIQDPSLDLLDRNALMDFMEERRALIAIDTNLLVYALDRPSPFHAAAKAALRQLAEGPEPWAIPWPCIYEFLRVVTRPRVFRPPLAAAAAMQAVKTVGDAPGLHLLAETPRHAELLAIVMEQSGVTGNLVHDAHIWTLCLEHGVSEFWSGDRDFSRFEGLRLRNPFAPSPA